MVPLLRDQRVAESQRHIICCTNPPVHRPANLRHLLYSLRHRFGVLVSLRDGDAVSNIQKLRIPNVVVLSVNACDRGDIPFPLFLRRYLSSPRFITFIGCTNDLCHRGRVSDWSLRHDMHSL